MKNEIQTTEAPKPLAPYSQGIKAGNTLYLSGQIPLKPESGELIRDNPEQEIRQVLENLKAVANAAGAELDQVVKLNVFLIDPAYFPILNKLMTEYFHHPYPARSTLIVQGLPMDAKVEMDAILIT